MIREVRREEIPMCVEVIKKSFITVADEYGFTEENAPKFTAFATTTDKLYWHMDGEHRLMYVFEEDGVGPLPIEPPLSSFPIVLDILAIPHTCKPAMSPCPSMPNTVPKPPPVIASHSED